MTEAICRRALLQAGILSLIVAAFAEAQTPGQVGGQSLNPDISAIGELLLDFSPKRPRVTSNGESRSKKPT
jgi:hypothetical protein